MPVGIPDPPFLRQGAVEVRGWVMADAERAATISADPDVALWTYLPDGGLSEAQARSWISSGNARRLQGLFRLAICDLQAGGLVVGCVGVEVDWASAVGEGFYWLERSARGRGLGTVALCLLTGWAFAELGIERLHLLIDPRNSASEAVARRAGYEFEGVLRSYREIKGRRVDLGSWSVVSALSGIDSTRSVAPTPGGN
jgi:ribosomal-protein-alanine N-acetyltransferase